MLMSMILLQMKNNLNIKQYPDFNETFNQYNPESITYNSG